MSEREKPEMCDATQRSMQAVRDSEDLERLNKLREHNSFTALLDAVDDAHRRSVAGGAVRFADIYVRLSKLLRGEP